MRISLKTKQGHQAESTNRGYEADAPIAIIGLSGRYPQAETVAEYWSNLVAGKDSITDIPTDRWSMVDFFEADQDKAVDTGKSYCNSGGFVDGFSEFDALFFGISPADAWHMDPQERLFLQTCWNVLEEAGYSSARLQSEVDNQVGVFAGVTKTGYNLLGNALSTADQSVSPSTSFSSVANRVSYFFNFTGPSQPIDTMCSASLVAVHEACENLRRGDCRLAIAGGVNLYLHPSTYVWLCTLRMLSTEGRCKSFGEGGNGFVPGEGVGAVLLKPLAAAEADGDHIYGVIRGSSVNHGGKTHGYTVPSPKAQAAVIRQSLDKAGVDARTVSYIEAHGTGTALGDPIEITGLSQAFAADTNDKGFCAIGSAKSNIGHLEAAAGIAGLTKVLLQLQHKTLAPSLHADTHNPNINFEDTPFRLNQTATAWELPDIDGIAYPRRAGISSFGAGGVNAHVVVEEYVDTRPQAATIRAAQWIVLSAKNETRLQALAKQLIEYLTSQTATLTPEAFQRVAYTLQEREAMTVRLAFSAADANEMVLKLQAYHHGQSVPEMYQGQATERKSALARFGNEKQMAAMLATWLTQEKTEEILSLWVKGIAIDWSQLYAEPMPQRTHLPTYPFSKQAYWTEDAQRLSHDSDTATPVITPATTADPQTQAESPVELMLFEERWETIESLAVVVSQPLQSVVCFSSEPAYQQQLQAYFTIHSPETQLIWVSVGDGYQAHSETRYHVRPENPDDYRQLWSSIYQHSPQLDGVLYLWPLESTAWLSNPKPIVALLQTLSAASLHSRCLLLAGTYEEGLDRCYLESWLGFERSLGLVLPETELNVLITDTQAATHWPTSLWQLLHTSDIRALCDCKQQLWTPQLRAVSLDAPNLASHAVPDLRGKACLITGGCGGLGLLFAEHLARQYGAHLILTGRSTLSTSTQAQLDKLRALGSQVHYLQGDVSNEAQMRLGIEAATAKLGPIHGVIHAAGVSSGQAITEKTPEQFTDVIASKVNGTRVLDRVLAAEPLDFMCYFSSSAAILGDFGVCDYAVGNRFEMAYAGYRNDSQAQGNTFAIQWPLWKEGGMGFGESEQTAFYLRSSGQSILTAEDGLSVFDQLLGSEQSSCLVMKGDRARVEGFLGLAEATSVAPEPAPVAVVPTNDSARGQRPEMRGLTLKECVLLDLTAQVSELLRVAVDDLSLEQNLADYGFNSISLLTFSRRLSSLLNTAITPSLFFSYPTLSKLADYFMADHNDTLLAVYGSSEPTGSATTTKKHKHNPNHTINPRNTRVPEPSAANQASAEPIAVIGMSGRFPQARSIDAMWEMLLAGENAVTEIPSERFDWREYFGDPTTDNTKTNSKWLAAVQGVDEFDPLFFEISPREASEMDPRQRLLLQETWKALEDAGYGEATIAREKVGMFVGVEEGDYASLGKPGSITSTHNGILASRLAYFLDLHGPALAINTACSSGLVAAHQACLSLRSGESTMAIAAGANILLSPDGFVGMGQAGMLSSDGACHAFDRRANGMVPGEAVVAVVLKTLKQAQADGDPIYGVIRGSGINNDGKTNGITAPSGASQAMLLEEVYQQCDLHPEQISYIVAHGTGTELGDPIEVNALVDTFKQHTDKKNYCALTSTKTNFGHTFAASGLVSAVSLLMAMRHQTIPASLHAEQQSDYIHWQDSPFYVNQKATAWARNNGQPLIGAVSAFGMSGTNAHMVFEEYQPLPTAGAPVVAGYYALPLSAKTPEVLTQQITDLMDFLQGAQRNNISLASLAYTLQRGRHHFAHRCLVIVSDIDEAIYNLQALRDGKKRPTLFQAQVKAGFVPNKALQLSLKQLLDTFLVSTESDEQRDIMCALADLYCQGYEPHWESLYGEPLPVRMHLPTYPFRRHRYWINDNKSDAKASKHSGNEQGISREQMAAVSEPLATDLLFYEETWTPITPESIRADAMSSIKTLVCFLSEPLLQQRLSEALHRINPAIVCIFIAKGACYQQQSDTVYQVPATDGDSYTQTFSDISNRFGDIDGLLYLWSLDSPQWRADCSPIVTLLNAMTKASIVVDRLVLAGQYANALERCYLDAWLGIQRSLALVLPNTYTSVLLREEPADASLPAWVDSIQRVFSHSKAIAELHCDKQYHSPKINPITLSAADNVPAHQGAVLISGGAGGLGFLFAEHVAKTQRRPLILTGRSAITTALQVKLDTLSALGSEVFYLQADITDKTQMAAGLSKIKPSIGAITGVIHAAGLANDIPITKSQPSDFNQVLRPKIQGTQILDEVLKDEPLDFMCYFSSSAAILGDFGNGCYAMANRFEIAYAHYRNQLAAKGERSGKAIVVQWPLWKEGGMGFEESEQTTFYLRSSGQSILTAEDGLAVFDQLLRSEQTSCLVMKGNKTRIDRFLGLGQASEPKPAVAAVVEPAATTPNTGRRPEIQGLNLEQCLAWDLKEQVSQLLDIPHKELMGAANLADYGFDSISLAQFARALSRHFQLKITPAVFFSHATLDSLSEYFLRDHASCIQTLYGEAEVPQPVSAPVFSSTPESTSQESVAELMKPVPSAPQQNFTSQSSTSTAAVDSQHEPIAIIGVSGRFPQARSVGELWDILIENRNAVEEIPTDRFAWQDYYSDDPDAEGKTQCKWGGFIPGVAEFDTLFFEISPREAELLDPRQRQLLQEAWKALEDAAYGPAQLEKQTVGMFVGVEEGDYGAIAGEGGITSNHTGILASRLAYFLNLSGPALAINTACSSGLVAAHQACLSLRSGECDTAIVGSVNLLLRPEAFVGMSAAGMLSSVGQCQAFAQTADGMVPGEAAVALVLKPLSKAQADGDPIRGLIRGSGLNYDGKTNGITAPSGASQTKLLKNVYQQYQIDPTQLDYIVTHGTGTSLGDPIEINALYDAFKAQTEATGFCALTSSKSNLGHTFAASGLVSIVNLLQSFEHETIPASLHCAQENDYIPWQDSPFYVNKTNKPWPKTTDSPRLGAVSAFGMSGTNAHLVLSDYSAPEQSADDACPYYLLVLSAKRDAVLKEQVQQLIHHLTEGAPVSLWALSYTLLTGRHHFDHRCAVVVSSVSDAIFTLQQWLDDKPRPTVFSAQVSRQFSEQAAMRSYALALLGQETALQNTPQKYQETLCALSDFYCQGYGLPWAQWFGERQPRRLNLPTYPFVREQYWVEENVEQKTEKKIALDKTNISVEKHPRSAALYKKDWQLSARDTKQRSATQNNLILATDDLRPLAEHLAQRIANAYICMPEEYLAISGQLSEGSSFDGCIDLTGLSNTSDDNAHWLVLLQTLISFAKPTHLRLLQLTRNLESFNASEPALAGAKRVGLYRMLQSEYRYVISRHMDTDLNLSDRAVDIERLVQQLVDEWQCQSQAPAVCYRQGVRYQATLKQIADSTSLKNVRPKTFPADHVLWITGGTRGIGLRCAHHFVEHYGVKKLVLTGLQALPQPQDWDNALAAAETEQSVREKLQAFKALSDRGVAIEVYSGALSDEKALAQYKQQIEKTMGPVGGVIHGAGLSDHENPAFIFKTPHSVEQICEPKIAGLNALHSVFAQEPLDFFIVFSSVSAIVPELASGQSDYALANAYMDYFVENQHRQGNTHYLSIQWPSWRDVGMGEVRSAAYQRSGLLSHSNEEGLMLLDKALAFGGSAVTLPAITNPTIFNENNVLQRFLPTENSQKTVVVKNETSGNSVSSVTAEGLYNKHSPVELPKKLIQVFSDVLKLPHERIEADKPFQDYGVDSIILAQLVRKIDREFPNSHVDPGLLLAHPTLASLNHYLHNNSVTPVENNQRDTLPELIHVFVDVLKLPLEQIDIDKPFQDYGVDSIILAQLVRRIDREFPDVNIDPSVLLEYANLSRLHQYLKQKLPLDVEQNTRVETPNKVSPPVMQTTASAENSSKPKTTKAAGTKTDAADRRVAVIGMACHFPDANTIEQYWENLINSKDSIREVPRSRWHADDYYHPQAQEGKTMSKWGGFLDSIEDFDPAFFEIREALASQVDPLQRQWLEVSAEALADAGYSKEDLWGKEVGVFAGARAGGFNHKVTAPEKDFLVGVAENFITAYLSHAYNFSGPNMVVDAACASSLTAIHLAAQSIYQEECDIALAGGVDILLDEGAYVSLTHAGVLSSDGRTKAFDESADGIGVGEGCGVLILKRLDKAIADGDKIYSVIEGSSVNSDGRTMGVTTPNPSAQKKLVEKAIKNAAVPPRSISYVEAHGTGTLIGDPIELRGLTSVFEQHTQDKQFCGIGSVKSNIGHLLSAAGAASMIKVILSMTHKKLPPTLHCLRPNPRFDFTVSPLYPVLGLQEWEGVDDVRRAGVSAFGLGGHNAHIIVSDAGIPENLRATTQPKGLPVVFNRHRYWPENNTIKIDKPASVDEDFIEFFDDVLID